MIDKRAKTQWEKSSISFDNYQCYLKNKSDKFSLSLIDLLFISNFKGGNSTINEPEKIIKNKLLEYSKYLKSIDSIIDKRKLSLINREELEIILKEIESICSLTHIGSNTKIDGFSISYLSALLSAYFIETIPILDRRILINLELVSENDLDSQKQIKKIENFYKNLIVKMWELTKQKQKSIREIDKEIFIKKLKTK